MGRQRKRIRRSVFYRFLISFALALMLPLTVLWYFVYRASVVSLRAEIDDLEASRVYTIQQLMDAELRELERLALSIAQDRMLNPRTLADEPYQAYVSRRLLTTHISSSGLLPDVFLMFNNSDLLYSNRGTLRRSTLLEFYYQLPFGRWAEFLSYTESELRPEIIPWISDESVSDPDRRRISLVYSMPIVDRVQPQKIVFSVTEQALIDRMRSCGIEEHQFVCLGDVRNGILAAGSDDFRNMEAFSFDRDFAASSIVLNKRRYHLSAAGSDYYGLTYLLISPEAELYRIVNRSKLSATVLLLAVALGSATLAALLSRINFRPIQKLSRQIQRSIPQSTERARRDELDEIAYGIDLALAEKKKLTEQLRNQQPLVREQVLCMILRGETLAEQEIDQLCLLCDIDLRAKRYRVVSVSWFTDGDHPPTYQEAAQAIIRAGVSCLTEISVEPVEMAHRELAVLVASQRWQLDAMLIEPFAAAIASELSRIGAESMLGIGTQCGLVGELGDSYMEALEAAENASLSGLPYAFFEEIPYNESSKQRYRLPTEAVAAMSRALKQGNYSDYRDAVTEVVNGIRVSGMSSAMSRVACFSTVNTVISAMNELRLDIEETDIDKLASFETLDQLQSRLLVGGRRLCSIASNALESQRAVLRRELLDFVECNFQDPMLSLDVVADAFGFSTSHVSRLFRSISGTGFAELVRDRRMAEAKRLLRDTPVHVKTVVRNVGYSDPANFIRTFRRYEGVTPMQYRGLHGIRLADKVPGYVDGLTDTSNTVTS